AAHRVTLHFSLRSCFHHHWFGQGAGALQRAWFAAVADPLPDGLAAAGPAWGGSFLQKRTVETIEAVAQFAGQDDTGLGELAGGFRITDLRQGGTGHDH